MPVNVRSGWRVCLSCDTVHRRRFVTEQELRINALHMMLGVKSDFFHRHLGDMQGPIITVNSSHLSQVECSHVSPGAVRNILCKFAQIGTAIAKLRYIRDSVRFKHGEASIVASEVSAKYLARADNELQLQLISESTSLLSLLCAIRPLSTMCKTVARFILDFTESNLRPFLEIAFAIGRSRTYEELEISYAPLLPVRDEEQSDQSSTFRARTMSRNHMPQTELPISTHPSFYIYFVHEDRIVAS